MNCLWEANGNFVCEKVNNKKIIEGFEENNINNYWQNSIDYPQNDISSQYVKNTDQCKTLCINDKRCIGTVYANNNNNPYCWLKAKLDKNLKVNNAYDRNTWFKIDGPYNQTCKNCRLPAYDGNPNVLSCQCKNGYGGWNRNAVLPIPDCKVTNNIWNENGNLKC